MKLSKSLHDLGLAFSEFNLNFDSLSLGQLESKEWLVDELLKLETVLGFGIVYVLCGWYGILSWMIFLKGVKVDLIRSFDIDPECEKIADRINKKHLADAWKFHAVTKDINKMMFSYDEHQLWSYQKEKYFEECNTPDTIINTSCEHLSNHWFNMIPGGQIVALQSTNFYDGEGHINCVENLLHMRNKYPLREVFYQGVLETEKYKRFMLIGVV